MRKILLMLPVILLIGCTSKIEENKYSYLEYKSQLEKKETFTKEDQIDFNTYFNIEREDEEVIKYSMTINDPNVDMHNVKALLIHDYIQEEAFPSVGILGEPVELLKNTNDKIELTGTIQTTEDISNVKYKLYLEYIDDQGLENKIYYQVSRG